MTRIVPPQLEGPNFRPAPEVEEWMRTTFIEPDGQLVNGDHAHLRHARIGVLWTTSQAISQMRRTVGTAEIFMPRGKPWVKERQRFQLLEWFGAEPDFLLTFDARYAAEVDDATWCALVEHELYHCAQKVDEWGAPRFHSRTGLPLWAIKGHDVEEFVGVVRRYGAGAAAGATAALVKAARAKPEVAAASIAAACGTCQLKVA